VNLGKTDDWHKLYVSLNLLSVSRTWEADDYSVPKDKTPPASGHLPLTGEAFLELMLEIAVAKGIFLV
jgi:hypothetical protein